MRQRTPEGRAYKDEWRKNNPEKTARHQRNNKLKLKFGITLDDYEEMWERQQGLCAICEQPELVERRVLAVDHNHETNTIRALLCTNCNHGLGKFQDDPELLRKAALYVEAH